jgi:hypothetical protein
MQVTVNIKTASQQYPGGTVGGDWRIEAALASDPGTVAAEYEGPNPSATFDLTEGETYNLRAVRLDAGGAVLGPVATAQFVVGSDLVEIDVANAVIAISSPVSKAKAAKK